MLPLNFLRHFIRIYISTVSAQKISFSIAIHNYTIQEYLYFFFTDIQLSWFVSGLVDFLVFLVGNSILSLPRVKVWIATCCLWFERRSCS
jgi:hypothetical protein